MSPVLSMNSLKTVNVNLLLLFYFRGLFKCFEISCKSCAKFFLCFTVSKSVGENGLRFKNHWNVMKMKAMSYIIPLLVSNLASFQRHGFVLRDMFWIKFWLSAKILSVFWEALIRYRQEANMEWGFPPSSVNTKCMLWKKGCNDWRVPPPETVVLN